jgi:thiosulfate reductase cytochrome b subunit
MSRAVSSAMPPPELYYRHRLPVRVMHWINVICLTVLFMSGLNIFNAHPALNWGKSSYNGQPPLLEIGAKMSGSKIIGVTRVGDHEFDTTGLLGAFPTASGEIDNRAFPSWLTIPSTQWLAMARRWHFFFAWLFVINGIAYVAWTGEPSAARSPITSGSGIRQATKRSATTCCKSSRTSP